MSSAIHLNVLDIYLDNDNPRHDPISDQSEIIEYLIKNENVKQLARHISQNGVNPLDSIGVVKSDGGSYIVVEGNRRLCALTLLNDPEKAPKHDVQYFKKLSENSELVPSFISCVLFDNHSEADVWMVVRHDGEQNGIGTKKWNTEQKARNNAKINRKDDNALGKALIDYAVTKGILPKDRPEKILTTASRYLGNPRFRSTFGIVSGRSEKDVEINALCHEFDRMLKKFCADLVENTKVNSRSKKPDWEKYAIELTESGIAPTSKVQVHGLHECLSAPDPITQPSNVTYDIQSSNGIGKTLAI